MTVKEGVEVIELARGSQDGERIHVGDQLMIQAEVLNSAAGLGALVRLYSKTDELQIWVAEAHLRHVIVEHLPFEPPDGTWLLVDGSDYRDGRSQIFHRDDAQGHSDDRRRHDEHWWDVVAQEWIDWPAAVRRGAASAVTRRMVVKGEIKEWK